MRSKKIAILFLDSINSLMAHRIFLQVEDTIEEEVNVLMSLYIKDGI